MFAMYLEASSGRAIRLSRADARRDRAGVAGEDGSCAEPDARCPTPKFTVGEGSIGDDAVMADFKSNGPVDASADCGCVRLSWGTLWIDEISIEMGFPLDSP